MLFKRLRFLGFGCCQFESYAVNINDFQRRIFLQVFSQFCDIHIHTSCIKITIIKPYLIQGISTVEHIIHLVTQQFEQFSLFGSEFVFNGCGAEELKFKTELAGRYNVQNIACAAALAAAAGVPWSTIAVVMRAVKPKWGRLERVALEDQDFPCGTVVPLHRWSNP